MDKKINILIKKYSDKTDLLNKLVVSAFLRCHCLEAEKGVLAQFVVVEKDELATDIHELSTSISFEDVITIFELAIRASISHVGHFIRYSFLHLLCHHCRLHLCLFFFFRYSSVYLCKHFSGVGVTASLLHQPEKTIGS